MAQFGQKSDLLSLEFQINSLVADCQFNLSSLISNEAGSDLLHLSECQCQGESKHLAGFYSPAGLIYTTVYCTSTGLIYKFIKYIILPPTARHRERAEC